MRCLTGASFTMDCEILHWQGITAPEPSDVDQGAWTTYQDPITGEIRNKWVPTETDNPDTPAVDPTVETVSCIARGVISNGIKLTGTSEVFGDMYQSFDYVRLEVPASVVITKRDRVTNIREKKGGNVIWIDEELGLDDDGNYKPTVFNVNGVTPILDPFNRHIKNLVFLERATF